MYPDLPDSGGRNQVQHLTFQPCCYPRAEPFAEIWEYGLPFLVPDSISISELVSISPKKRGEIRLTLNFETSTGHVSCSPFSGNHLQLVCRLPWQSVEMKSSDLSARRDRNVLSGLRWFAGFDEFVAFDDFVGLGELVPWCLSRCLNFLMPY